MRLTLIRHAKSSWDNPADSDHQRPLNARGRRDAPRIGTWLAAQGPLPQIILCSDAQRTRETCALITAQWAHQPEITFTRALYHASPAEIIALLRTQTADRIAVIAHNPGIGALADQLAATAPAHPRFFDYPTAATTVLETDLSARQAIVQAFTTPHDL